VEYLNHQLVNVVKHADHIITDSEFVRAEIIDMLGADPQKVTAIALGADSVFYARSEPDCRQVMSHYQLEYNDYFLFVSTLEPRKNLLNLLAAYEQYRKKCSEGLPLVIVGDKGWHSEEIHHEVAKLSAKGWVKYLGYISSSRLVVLYSAARALLFPSIYEGFGLPVLEAMQSGTAVMTCENTSMTEITLHHAALTDKDDIAQMTMHITRLTEDQAWVQALSQAGLRRAKDFSWENCTAQTLEVYRSLD
jgi:alpha-1,3-rhamnosyl/mannosyltransferase